MFMSIFRKNVNLSTNLCQYFQNMSIFQQIDVNISKKCTLSGHGGENWYECSGPRILDIYRYIYIYICMAFRMHLRRGLRQLFFHAPFAFPMCLELSQCNHASVHASNLLFTEHFLDISFMFPAYFLCIVWSLPR